LQPRVGAFLVLKRSGPRTTASLKLTGSIGYEKYCILKWPANPSDATLNLSTEYLVCLQQPEILRTNQLYNHLLC